MILSVPSYQKLLTILRTSEDIALFSSEVEQLQQTVYRTDNGGLEQLLSTRVSVSVAKVIEEILQEEKIGFADYERLSELFPALLAISHKLPLLQLTFGVEPSRQFIWEVSEWVRKHMVPDGVLQIQIDNKILGGVKVIYKGWLWDYSLEKSIAGWVAKQSY
jgi:hypothetical protein